MKLLSHRVHVENTQHWNLELSDSLIMRKVSHQCKLSQQSLLFLALLWISTGKTIWIIQNGHWRSNTVSRVLSLQMGGFGRTQNLSRIIYIVAGIS